ncbi:MAG: hypothetical protein U0263_32975 [Polyangiaceae bacterium]
MGIGPWRSRSSLAVWLSSVAIVAFAASADAAASPVALGEVKVVRSDPGLERQFRGLVVHELDEVDLSKVKASDRFVLSASLVQMNTRENAGQAESLAVVSATLRRARGGSIHAIIQGRAQASDRPTNVKAVELNAMRAAVRSALGRLPEALK